MTQEEIGKFKADLQTESLQYMVTNYITDRVPYCFHSDQSLYLKWKDQLSRKVGFDSKEIVFTGSSALGISLNPRKNFKAYNEKSDIDLAIISNHYFEQCWFYLRTMGTKRYRLTEKQKRAVDDHISRLIYYGTIATDKIVEIFPFGKPWVIAADEMSKIEPTVGRQINFRIYKDHNALRLYQEMNLKSLKNKILLNA